jgi:predicted AlkP superfamily pyrophosphatase or phosphodiesterase
MVKPRFAAIVSTVILAVLLAAPLPAIASSLRAQDATPVAAESGAGRVLLFVAPGMEPDLVASFAAEGALPAMAEMMENGASAEGGLVGAFPATSGTNVATLLTGTWPAEHGIVGNIFYRTGSPDFANGARWTDPGLALADTLPQAAERAGKQVVAVVSQGFDALERRY